MDIIRRNRQIDSLKFLILKCQDGNSLMSTVDSKDESLRLDNETDNLKEDCSTRKAPYEDELLNDLSALSDPHSRLREATLLSDSNMLCDPGQQLPGATLLTDLVRDVDQLGSHLALIGENMELLGWRLLQNKFTAGLDLSYEHHGAVKSLLNQMNTLISDLSNVELWFQKAAMYKPSRKLNDDLTKAVRSLLDLRSKLENIQSLRQSCSAGVLAGASSSSERGRLDSTVQAERDSAV